MCGCVNTARSASADPTQPVYLIEVGTGHGKLTYMLLRALVDMREYWPVHVKQPFVYVMTDFTQVRWGCLHGGLQWRT